MYHACTNHGGSLPLIGVNTILDKEHAGDIVTEIEMLRSTEGEGQQITKVHTYQHGRDSFDADGLKFLQTTARRRENCFAALMEAVKIYSLGQISHALYDVRGECRRNM